MVKNDPKWAKMCDFGHFLKNRSPTSSKGSKIDSGVLFCYPGICATQQHLRRSISISNHDLVSFFNPKIVDFWVFWEQAERPQKEEFLVENAIFRLKQHDFYLKNEIQTM